MTTDEKLDKLFEVVEKLNLKIELLNGADQFFIMKFDQHLEAHREGFEPMLTLLRQIVSILESKSSSTWETKSGK